MNYGELFHVTLPETALDLAALLVLLVDLAFLRKAALQVRLSSAAVIGVIGCLAAMWAVGMQTSAGFSVDGLLVLANGGVTAVAQMGVLVLTAVTLLLLIDSSFTKHPGEFVAVVLMAASGGLVISAARDLLVIFIGLELLSIGLYILTAFGKTSAKSAEAALKYYLFGGMSAAFLLFGFSYFYGLTGSTNLYEIQSSIANSGSSPLLIVAWVLVVAGLGFKVAAVPFHLWAPDTYEGAPAPAAAFIASVSKIASFTLLLTFSFQWLQVSNEYLSGARPAVEHYIVSAYQSWQHLALVLLIAAVASMIVGNLAALAQTSVRRLLAYSAIAHAGYILLGIAIYSTYSGQSDVMSFWGNAFNAGVISQNAVLYYVLTYGLTTIGAFGVIGVVERTTGSDKLDAFLGLHKRNPVLAAVLLILFLSLAGIPPLVGFWAKFNLFAAVLAVGGGVWPFALVALAVAMSAVSLYYYLQVLKRAYVMPAVDDTPIHVHPVTMLVLMAIAAAVVLAGCLPSVLQGWIASF
ncbi:NADH-quinone oxidoreductase subunit N [Terracidiphilus sp.]|jgi:NADH-quinone oxidoreductase subunit N|uniref:NADH-quinone oxidoreductase subunit N n=1 Tax=Terracidiphilus sp. TaxID=1964191 RepID=UPI003C179A33